MLHYKLKIIFFLYILFPSLISCDNDNKNNKTSSPIFPIEENSEDTKIKHPPIQYATSKMANEAILLNPIEEGKLNEKKESVIIDRIEAMTSSQMQEWTEKTGLSYPPKCILFRVFKLEGELEVWGANNSKDAMHLIQTFPVCAMDRFPGPKLQEGDGRTPEGFYKLKELYGSTLPFMWIKLNPDEIDDYGEVNEGSSFKLWLNYPNSVDKKQTKKVLGDGVSPGSEICMHGNCVSSGCVSMENRIYMIAFAFANHHQSRYGKPTIHIFPFRFSEALKNFYMDYYELEAHQWLVDFWNNLEEGYQRFERERKLLKVREKNGVYVFH